MLRVSIFCRCPFTRAWNEHAYHICTNAETGSSSGAMVTQWTLSKRPLSQYVDMYPLPWNRTLGWAYTSSYHTGYDETRGELKSQLSYLVETNAENALVILYFTKRKTENISQMLFLTQYQFLWWSVGKIHVSFLFNLLRDCWLLAVITRRKALKESSSYWTLAIQLKKLKALQMRLWSKL